MPKIKRNLLFSTLILIAFTNIHAQTKFEVPKNLELKTKEDYAKYEPTIVDAAKWLEETDLDKERNKRKDVNAFILEWVSGSPTVTVDIDQNLAKIYGKNTQL